MHSVELLYISGRLNSSTVFCGVCVALSLVFCVVFCSKMKKKKYHIVGTFLKLNITIVERDKIDTPSTQIYKISLPGWVDHCLPLAVYLQVTSLLYSNF